MKETIEKHQLKITISVAVVVLLFIIGATMQFSNWKSSVEQDILLVQKGLEHHSNAYNSISEIVEDLENKNLAIQVRFALIETKLNSIETILMEIKNDLKK